MKREIKFRAWHSRLKKMVSPDQFFGKCNHHSPAYELMQFTGLKDKNGKDIYEGDILRRGEDVSFVVWELDHWCLNSYMQVGRGLYANVDKTRHKGFEIAEIVGNIHENPELLK